MTTGLYASFAPATGHRLQRETRRSRAIIVAALAVVCIGVALPLAARLGRTPAPQPAIADAGLAGAIPNRTMLARTKAALAPDVRPEIDAISTLLAKRYRISAVATRGMVSTAYREGHRLGVDPLLIVAVIAVESRFNPIAESVAGAQGLMQVIPGYHKDKFEAANVDSVLDPHDNIRLGVRVLKEYIRQGGTEVAGLQLYNGSADDATTSYANKVLAEKGRLEQAVQRSRERARA